MTARVYMTHWSKSSEDAFGTRIFGQSWDGPRHLNLNGFCRLTNWSTRMRQVLRPVQAHPMSTLWHLPVMAAAPYNYEGLE